MAREIDLSALEGHEVIQASLNRLLENNDPPVLFQRDLCLTRVDVNDEGAHMTIHNESSLRGALKDAADFGRWSTGSTTTGPRWTPLLPPADVAKIILAEGKYPGVPYVDRVVSAPVYGADGRQLSDGYNESCRTYLARAKSLVGAAGGLPVNRALEVLDDLIADFALSPPSRAHVLALMLTPLVREMIDGPTPLFVVDAPKAGAGKTLLSSVVLLPVCGEVEATHAPRDEVEMQKLLASLLRTAPTAVLLDNLESTGKRLEAPSLARALTANPVYQDRLLSRNQLVRVKVRNAWVLTGNGVLLSGELARRSVWINLPQAPEGVRAYRHQNLLAYSRGARARLFAALASLVDDWLEDGEGERTRDVPQLPSFEEWSGVVGSILWHAGVRGFGRPWHEHVDEDEVDPEDDELAGLLAAWKRAFGPRRVTSQEVIAAALINGDLAASMPAVRSSYALGQHLLKWKGRRVDGARIVREGRTWRLALDRTHAGSFKSAPPIPLQKQEGS